MALPPDKRRLTIFLTKAEYQRLETLARQRRRRKSKSERVSVSSVGRELLAASLFLLPYRSVDEAPTEPSEHEEAA